MLKLKRCISVASTLMLSKHFIVCIATQLTVVAAQSVTRYTCLAACEFRCNAGVKEGYPTFVNNPDCIKQYEVCDGWALCADGQDEAGCGKCRLSNQKNI
jgi:hypothetical protein